MSGADAVPEVQVQALAQQLQEPSGGQKRRAPYAEASEELPGITARQDTIISECSVPVRLVQTQAWYQHTCPWLLWARGCKVAQWQHLAVGIQVR